MSNFLKRRGKRERSFIIKIIIPKSTFSPLLRTYQRLVRRSLGAFTYGGRTAKTDFTFENLREFVFTLHAAKGAF